MEAKVAQFVNKGMYKDLSISKAVDEFAYHNNNIRITAINGENLFSVTNERGTTTKSIDTKKKRTDNPITLVKDSNGNYIISSKYKTASKVYVNLSFKTGRLDHVEVTQNSELKYFNLGTPYQVKQLELQNYWIVPLNAAPDSGAATRYAFGTPELDTGNALYEKITLTTPDPVLEPLDPPAGVDIYYYTDDNKTLVYFVETSDTIEIFEYNIGGHVLRSTHTEQNYSVDVPYKATIILNSKKVQLNRTDSLEVEVETDWGALQSVLVSELYDAQIVSVSGSIEGGIRDNYYVDPTFVYRAESNIVDESEYFIVSPIAPSNKYIGHCIANNYLVLFTHDALNNDRIYRITEDNGTFLGEQIFVGPLDFSQNKPIETLFYYESEDIQKVYWVDGKNQTRVINIMKNDYINGDPTQFDFVPIVNNIPVVSIKKEFNAFGNFHSGTIQYYITYYNKFGAESRIVWESALQYIAPKDRGGAQDEFVGCSFSIDIKNIDISFDYLRVYSAKRNSLDGPIELNIVGDFNIKGKLSVDFIDDGTNQEAVDASLLHFIGGDEFIAHTMTQKDDTLFLGNIELSNATLPDGLKPYIKENWIEIHGIREAKRISFEYKCFREDEARGFYPHMQQINSSSLAFKTFKRGEIYRFAIQYQNKSGVWSEPIWIGDKKCDLIPKRFYQEPQTMVPTATFQVDANAKYQNLVKDFLGYRILMAETSAITRNVLAQGIVNPTIFKYDQRVENKPFAMASYIMRPRNSNVEYKHFYPLDDEIFGCIDESLPSDIENTIQGEGGWYKLIVRAENYEGAFGVIQYECVLEILRGYDNGGTIQYPEDAQYERVYIKRFKRSLKKKTIRKKVLNLLVEWGLNIGIENESVNCLTRDDFSHMLDLDGTIVGWGNEDSSVQKNEFCKYRRYYKYVAKEDLSDITIPQFTQSNSFNNQFYVDESIVTLNSPDLEDNFRLIDNNNLKFRIVGIAPITSSFSNYKIDLNENNISNVYSGTQKSLPMNYYKENISLDTNTLVSDYLYNNKYWIYDNNEIKLGSGYANYKVFMWHKSGSLFGGSNIQQVLNFELPTFDVIYEDLKSKMFATQRFSIGTEYFEFDSDSALLPITNPQIFDSDGIVLKKINLSDTQVNYYGNYQDLFKPRGNHAATVDFEVEDEFIQEHTSDGKIETVYNEYVYNINSLDPVKIAYKSNPHAVFALANKEHKALYKLPLLKSDDNTEQEFNQYSFTNINGDIAIAGVNIIQGLGIYTMQQYVYATVVSKAQSALQTLYNTGDDIITILSQHSDVQYCISLTKEYSGQITIPKVYGSYWVKLNNNSTAVDPVEITNIEHYTINIAKDGGDDVIGDFKNIQGDYYKINSINGEVQADVNLFTYQPRKTISYETSYPYLFIGELYRELPYASLYGGYNDDDIEKITWIPISSSFDVDRNIDKMEGDTYYQRWDCVKTIPWSRDEINQVIDITSVMLESHINLDGRYDRNRGNIDLTNITNENFNKFNPVYSQTNNNFRYNILDDKFDLDKFSNQVIWSNQKNPTEDVDTWTNISQFNSLYLEGQHGPINKLMNIDGTITAFQDNAIAAINFNNQTQISTEQGLPIEVVNSGKVNGYQYITKNNGCHNKWSIHQAVGGVYFIDDYRKSFMRISKNGLENLSNSCGFSDWFKNNINGEKWTILNQAFRVSSDDITNDVYLVRNTIEDGCLDFNEKLNSFTSFLPYNDCITMFNLNGKSYYLSNRLNIEEMFSGTFSRDFSMEYNINPEPLLDKTFTNIEYIADTFDNGALQQHNPFSLLTVGNEYQNGQTDLTGLRYPNASQRFRVWRADIPRSGAFDRIRNPWMKLTLHGNPNINGQTTFHSLLIKYFK